MDRDEWINLYDVLRAIYDGKLDVLEVMMSVRAQATSLGLLTKDRNGNTKLSQKALRLFKNGRK